MKLTNEVYSKLAVEFFNDNHKNSKELHVGLLEEVHEVKEAIKVGTRKDLLDELGDVLWYVTVMAHCEGSSLSELMMYTLEKLEDRRLNGKKSKTKGYLTLKNNEE